jgi:fructose-1,6-bisphosphatase/inositol monophosphatase family enzyme
MMKRTFELEWLHSVLDRCRDVVARKRAPKQWNKTSTHGGKELVTEVDVAVERLLTEAIKQRLPNASILSEESSPDPSAMAHETCFVIDPIDGTAELVAGRPGFAISIALFHNQLPVAALLDQPAHDRRFQCTAGGGTTLNGRVVRLREVESLSQARIAVSATQYQMEDLQSFWANIGFARVPTPAFAAKFAVVLAGECNAALNLPVQPHETAIWDYAAPALLLTEAGGWFGTTDGTDLLRNQPFLFADGWIASPPGLRDSLLAVARRVPDAGRSGYAWDMEHNGGSS